MAVTFSKAETWLCITTLLYFLMNGAQIFETFVVIPKWTAAPPNSFLYFEAPYGLNLKRFWILLHSLHEISFVLALVFCWNTHIRNLLLILAIAHFMLRAWTIIYFAPNIMAFEAIANGAPAPEALAGKVTLWKNLNYLRVALFVVLSIWLVNLCWQLLQHT